MIGWNEQDQEAYSRSSDYTPPQYASLRPIVASSLADIIKSGGGKKFEGPFVAPITEDELATLANMMRMQDPSGAEVAGSDLLQRTIEGEFLDPKSNPFISKYVSAAQEQVREAYDEDEMQRRALFARAGHALPESSPFATAQTESQGELAEALSDIATNVYFGTYQAERAAQQQAVDQERINQATMFAEAMANLEAQALPRMIEQMGIDRALEEFYRRQQMLANALNIAGNLGIPTLGYESESSGSGYGVSLLWGSGSAPSGNTVNLGGTGDVA